MRSRRAALQPRVIWVSLQHPSPYYDDSYGVNSANNGPFGDAIMQELLPLVETKFRIIREPWARMLSGGSTGGWIAVAHQVFYPDFYGGLFALCPDRGRLPVSPDREHQPGCERLLGRQGMGEGRAADRTASRRQRD